jgi:Ca-activated chloride channel homolog
MIRLSAIACVAICALLLAGKDAASVLALRLGAPSISLAASDDLLLRGLALYRLGRFAESAELLRQAGPLGSFNRGNALARAGKYADAVAAYDAVIARDPSDADAKANRAIVIELVESETEGGGGSRAQGTEMGEHKKAENKNDSMTMEEAFEAQRLRAIQVQRPQESKAVIADEQWLVTLSDEPGRYLKLRIAAEYKRRIEQGLAPPPGDDPW